MDTKTKPKASHYLLLGILALGVSYGCTNLVYNLTTAKSPVGVFLCGIAIVAHLLFIGSFMSSITCLKRRPKKTTFIVSCIVFLIAGYGSLEMAGYYGLFDYQCNPKSLCIWWLSLAAMSAFAFIVSLYFTIESGTD